ncbi:DUF58 domain-containing protein [Haloarchaeobius amylolyticus]|uniref:DUF58 domain-containing protein n=1 Tax=Haloarchaeobius amylolyticus TaxID=1198296 RepID=UPI00226E3C0B|nr:DUF58 domain-containing protein [Haloarchaeobius amylolyticus]
MGEEQVPESGPELDAGWQVVETGRWRGIVPLALAVVALGTLSANPAVLLAGVVCVGLAVARAATSAPDPSLACSRTVSDPAPAAGDRVSVALRVENTGEATLPDVRVADRMPTGLEVVDGTPETVGSLRPGESLSVTYTVTATPGRYRFESPRVVCTDRLGDVSVVGEPAVDETPIRCAAALPAAPGIHLRPPRGGLPGRVTGTGSGDGASFFGVREYRRGDPLARVDWARLARDGRLTTVTFREERAPTVVLVVDGRAAAFLQSPGEPPDARRRCLDAARTLVAGLDEAQVGLAVLGDGLDWTRPGTGRTHHVRLRQAIDDTAGAPGESADLDLAAAETTLRSRLPAGAQVCLLTPLCDDEVAALARRLDVSGTPVSVVAPDPTATATAGQRLAHLERRTRVRDLRRAGIPVLDWESGDATAAFRRGGWVR